MPDISLSHLPSIQSGTATPAQWAETLKTLQDAINNMGQQTNAAPVGVTPAPSQIHDIKVTAAGGITDVSLTDNNPIYRDINYFLEYSPSPVFSQPTVVHLGPSRNWRGNLGNQTLYWRAYSSYPTSAPSKPLHFGTITNPIAVTGGGAITGPNPYPSSGSGTAKSNGLEGGSGFGKEPFRSVNGRSPVRE